MKAIALVALAAALLFVGGCGRQDDLPVDHFVEEIPSTGNEAVEPSSDLAFGNHNSLDGIVALNLIVNTAATAWNLVQSNKAVTNVTSLYANALPSGARNGNDLESFSELNRRSFRSYGTNKFGATVYDVQYTVLHRHGGSYQGKGRFLDQVTVLPTYTHALWGYTVDVSVSASPPANVGTRESPIATLLLDLSVRVSTVFKSATTRRAFEFRGDDPVARDVGEAGARGARALVQVAAY